MRIGTYNMISQLYGTGTTKKSTTTKSTSYASFKDEISLSTAGKDMQIAKNALAKTPDVREDLVSSIKSRIENGTYEVDADDFAAKLADAFAAKGVF